MGDESMATALARFEPKRLKSEIAAAVSRARSELDEAMDRIDALPVIEVERVKLAAHALGNFLMVCDGTVDLLRHALRGTQVPEVESWLNGLTETTNLMSHTVSQLLNLSPVNDLKLKVHDVRLSQLAERVCNYYRRFAVRKQIAIGFRGTAHSHIADANRIAVAAVLDNLLSNAIKFSPMGKRVAVAVRRKGQFVTCSVCDEGPGLTAADKTNLFQRGVRLSAVPTGGEPSAGYGLSVAKELMTRMNGTIWCRSRAGEGACFFIRFRAADDTKEKVDR
jgi:signal transduction histidine kinase